MNTYLNLCLMEVAAQVLDKVGQEDVAKMLKEGRVGTAKVCVLFGVDNLYKCPDKSRALSFIRWRLDFTIG